MSAFRKVPELDWLKVLVEDFDDFDDGKGNTGHHTAVQLDTLYRYLLWMRRASLAHPSSPEHKVADGLAVKYHRRLYNVPMTDFEKKYVAEAEAEFKMMKRQKLDQSDLKVLADEIMRPVKERRRGKA